MPSMIDRAKVRRMIEKKLDDVTGVLWEYAGHEPEPADAGEDLDLGGDAGTMSIAGTLVGLTLDRDLLDPNAAPTAVVTWIIEVSCSVGDSERNFAAIDAAVQRIVTLISDVELRDTATGHSLSIHSARDDVDYGAEEAEGLIVGRVTCVGHCTRSDGTTVEEIDPVEAP